MFFAVSYSLFWCRTPLPATRCNLGDMAALPPLDSLADVDMVDVAWVLFVPRPSDMSTAPSTERGIHPRATVASQDLTVAPLEQTAAHVRVETERVPDICKWAYVFAPSFICVD